MALARLDVTPVDNPFTALSRLAGQAVAWQETIAGIVNQLGDRVRYEGAAGAEQLRAEIALYERAMDRCGHILGMIARLNIDERLAQVEEAKAIVVIAAVNAALQHAGLTGQHLTDAREVAARHLEVAAGQVGGVHGGLPHPRGRRPALPVGIRS